MVDVRLIYGKSMVGILVQCFANVGDLFLTRYLTLGS